MKSLKKSFYEVILSIDPQTLWTTIIPQSHGSVRKGCRRLNRRIFAWGRSATFYKWRCWWRGPPLQYFRRPLFFQSAAWWSLDRTAWSKYIDLLKQQASCLDIKSFWYSYAIKVLKLCIIEHSSACMSCQTHDVDEKYTQAKRRIPRYDSNGKLLLSSYILKIWIFTQVPRGRYH